MKRRELSWNNYGDARSIPGLSTASAASMVLRAHHPFALDRIPDFRKEKYNAPSADGINTLVRTIPGKNGFSHPSLEGMAFDPDDIRKATAALREADESIFVSNHHGTPNAPGTTLAARLIASEDFRAATRKKDLDGQLRICLEEIIFEIWVYNHTTLGVDPADAERDVRLDMSDAKCAIAELKGGHVETPLATQLHSMFSWSGMSQFHLAMRILLSWRYPDRDPNASLHKGARADQSGDTETELEVSQLLDVSDGTPAKSATHSGAPPIPQEAIPVEITPEIDSDQLIFLDQREPEPEKPADPLAQRFGECFTKPINREGIEQLRRQLRVDLDVIADLTDSVSDAKRHNIEAAMPIVERLIEEEWPRMRGIDFDLQDIPESKTDDAGTNPVRMRLMQSMSERARSRMVMHLDFFEHDPKNERSIKYLADLTRAIIAYEKTLRKLAFMDPTKPINQVEDEALALGPGMIKTGRVLEFISEGVLAPRFGEDRPAPRRVTKAMMDSLTRTNRYMIAQVVGAEDVTDGSLSVFLNMEAGVRELRLRNVVASAWTQGNWREDVARFDAACMEIYDKCGLPHSKIQELRIALSDPSNLSEDQREIIASFFGISPSHLKQEYALSFYIWLRGEPESLTDHWKRAFMAPERLEALKTAIIKKKRLKADDRVILARILGKEPKSLSGEDLANSGLCKNA